MKIFVTGASGFLGSAVVRQLLNAGHAVRAFIHSDHVFDTLAGLAIEKVKGDTADMLSIESAMAGCEAVFHLACEYSFCPWWDKKGTKLYKVNVEGTRNVLTAAKKNNVRRFIFTSTVATLGKSQDLKPANEETTFNLWRQASHYARSKVLAEREVLRLCDEGFPAIILNPGVLIGERDYKPTPSGEVIVKFLNQNLPFYFDAILSLADADDVAKTHVRALEKGRSGERYILCNSKPYTMKELLALLETISGVPAPKSKIPYPLVSVLLHTDELLSYWILKKKPFLPTGTMKYIRSSFVFDNSKAVKELGYKETPIAETLAKAVRWYQQNGYVRT